MVRDQDNAASEGAGLHPSPFIGEVSRAVIQQADQPDLVLDLSGPRGLAGDGGRGGSPAMQAGVIWRSLTLVVSNDGAFCPAVEPHSSARAIPDD